MTAPDPVRAGRALNGAAAGILALEGIATLFVPRGIAQTSDGLTDGRLAYLLVLSVVLILAAGIQRRPRGLIVGTALQVQVRKELLGSPFAAPRDPVPDDGDGGSEATP
jgi:hypothetical protein